MPRMRATYQTRTGRIASNGETRGAAACKAPPGAFEPVVDRNRCEGKGPCVEACPEQVLVMGTLDDDQRSTLSMIGRLKAWAHGNRQVQIAEPGACQACGACVRVCPERAITIRRRDPRSEEKQVMEKTRHRPARRPFDEFYVDRFLAEHRRPVNQALHVFGVLAGLLWLPLTLRSAWPWLVLLWPVVHAAPGLLGHRLFEQNDEIGDLRLDRRDAPLLWFIAANHRMTFELLLGRRPGDR